MNDSVPAGARPVSEVELAADGDERAFARLVAAHHPDMIRLAYLICGDDSLAQDAVQAAWLLAWRKLRALREPQRVRAWLLSVAANEARGILRRRRSAPVVELDLGIRAPERSDPSVGIARIDLVRALVSLSPDDRALLGLRYVAGFDAVEISQALGLRAGATRMRLSRLIARLRTEMGHD